ncbi:MAG TPA: sugar ABC transporter ATP-binding protein [Candidatus Aphodomonas merdavium]|nr:sugar ABC transporter ATP-binding protein [Candidatus Aphodomonas merdavium]
MEKKELLSCRGISKRFGSTVALDGVNLRLMSGDIRGLVGENGSGKSTLSSIIAGVQLPDAGEMERNERPHKPATMLDAQANGIAMIVQETGTVPGITVAANIFIGKEDQFSRGGILRLRAMMRAAEKALGRIGVTDIAPNASIDSLNFEDRKIIEIARAMYAEPDILIVDETTTALSQRGRDILYRIMREMASQGKGVLFISHDMDELMQVCNSITVLRDGQLVANLAREEMELNRIRTLMVGRELSDDYYRADYDGSYSPEVVLEGKHITVGPMLENFSFELHAGEILGIGGLTDSGMHDVGRAAFGACKLLTGEVWSRGKRIHSPQDAISVGVGYVPKNRDTDSIILDASIQDNIVLPALKGLSHHTCITPSSERTLAQKGIEGLSIKCREREQDVRDLSGGNRQKVAVAKWICNDTQIYIMDCPTRGIDISVKAYMYQLIYRLKKEGKAIMMISEEMAELIGMCDRIMVLKDGKVTKTFERSETLTETSIIHYMI